jgi:hypothetical protein
MTVLLLSLTYLLIIVPISVLARLFRADLLNLKLDGNTNSYWIKVEPDGPGSRPTVPY